MLYIFKSCIKKEKIYNKEKSNDAKKRAYLKALLLESELKVNNEKEKVNIKSKNIL